VKHDTSNALMSLMPGRDAFSSRA